MSRKPRSFRGSECSALLASAGVIGTLAGVAGAQLPASSPPVAPQKSGPVARDTGRPSTDDFRTLFGEAGETGIASVASGTADGLKVSTECGERLDADASDFLATWSVTSHGKDSTPKQARRASKPATKSSPKSAPKSATKSEMISSASKPILARLAQTAAAWQLSRIIVAAPESERGAVAREFLAHPIFARTLALVVDPQREDLARVLRIARLVMTERSEFVERFPELAAAIAVVNDAPVVVQVNENLAQGCGPLATFDHFLAGEKKMLFGIRGIAPELLIYVVDVAATSDEMNWALRKYAGNRTVGLLYDEIEYDFDHLEKGRPKKVTAAGWNLANILLYGGICADQAYFATTVGKSIGVPCVYTTATDGVLAHAWIGFVGKYPRGPSWDEIGRFGGYQSVEGFIRDPQTGSQISSTQMPMVLNYGLEPIEDRLISAALRIAASRLLQPIQGSTGGSPSNANAVSSVSAETIEKVLALTHVAVKACLTDARSWELIGRAAGSGAMSTEQKQQWSSDILTLCADSYPEFALRTIAPMIDSISDISARQEALDGALSLFSDRGDLAGQILLQQADLYKAQGNPVAAGRCYEMILSRYANDGPFAIVALQEASKLLAQRNDAASNVSLHERAFNEMEVPVGIAPQFARQSNWYRSGVMLAQALRIVGRERDATFHEQRMAGVMK